MQTRENAEQLEAVLGKTQGWIEGRVPVSVELLIQALVEMARFENPVAVNLITSFTQYWTKEMEVLLYRQDPGVAQKVWNFTGACELVVKQINQSHPAECAAILQELISIWHALYAESSMPTEFVQLAAVWMEGLTDMLNAENVNAPYIIGLYGSLKSVLKLHAQRVSDLELLAYSLHRFATESMVNPTALGKAASEYLQGQIQSWSEELLALENKYSEHTGGEVTLADEARITASNAVLQLQYAMKTLE